jgi:hypothetical protein
LHGSNKVEELIVELEKEKKERKKVSKEKEDLEAELENLTQSLFEEVRCLFIVLCFHRPTSPVRSLWIHDD